MKSQLPLAVLALLVIAAGPLRASQCHEDRDFYQSLPTVIGREDNAVPFGYQLKCDTVYVRKGVTTVVNPGTMLYFAKPTLNNVIKVEGTLVIKGSKNAYVYLSGSLDSSRSGTREPGTRPWGGIEVAEGGRLEMEYAGVMRAPTPITTFTDQVRIRNSFFKGSSGIILPDGNLLPMEVSWHAVNDLNLEKGTGRKPMATRDESKANGDGLTKEEKEALLAKSPGFWTWKRAAGGAAALAVVAVGAFYLAGDGESPAGPPEVKKTYTEDPLQPLPPTPKE